MTSNAQPAVNAAATSATPVNMRGEIGQRWGKFSAAEIAGFKDNDDLVGQVATKYGIAKEQAQREVDTLAKGRHLGAA